MANTLHLVSTILFVLAIAFFLASVTMWFVLKIPAVYNDLTGKTAQKTIEQLREQTGAKRKRATYAAKNSGTLENKKEFSGLTTGNIPPTEALPQQMIGNVLPPTEALPQQRSSNAMPPTEMLSHGSAGNVLPPTEMLSHGNAGNVLPPTEMLSHGNAGNVLPPTEMLSHGNAGNVLPPTEMLSHNTVPTQQTSLLSNKEDWLLLEDIMIIHTDETL